MALQKGLLTEPGGGGRSLETTEFPDPTVRQTAESEDTLRPRKQKVKLR